MERSKEDPGVPSLQGMYIKKTWGPGSSPNTPISGLIKNHAEKEKVEDKTENRRDKYVKLTIPRIWPLREVKRWKKGDEAGERSGRSGSKCGPITRDAQENGGKGGIPTWSGKWNGKWKDKWKKKRLLVPLCLFWSWTPCDLHCATTLQD